MSVSIPMLRRLHRLNGRAPEAAMLGLVLISAFGMLSSGLQMREHADESVTRVESSLREVPYRLGAWLGSDVPLTSGATEILHTTALLSRRYSNLETGESLSLAIVYCGDVRDMLGHHPPACYPASGWLPAPTGHERIGLDLGAPVTANLFRFRTTTSDGDEREISIVGFYLLPDGDSTHDSEKLRDMSVRRSISARGVGQVQVLLNGWPDSDRVRRVATEFLLELPSETLRLLAADLADRSSGFNSNPREDDGTSDRGGQS